MSGKAKSKTNVAARANVRSIVQLCKFCGNKVDVITSVSSTGRKRMRRLCCEGE